MNSVFINRNADNKWFFEACTLFVFSGPFSGEVRTLAY